MIKTLSCAAAVFVGSHAQLVYTPLDELRKTVGASPPEEHEAAEGFVHPQICDTGVNQTAGYLKAADDVSAPKYFFWLFESRSDPVKDPLIMWLSGGPGCSSQLALFAENGPCSVSKDGTSTVANKFSWNTNANVLWVDQPAGVGFSTGLGTHDEAGVASNMLMFLQEFFKQFPQYSNTDFYIFGESYGGHYVPAIAHKIWETNKGSSGIHIPMKGISIGNGLTNPEVQYPEYPEMGHDGGKSQGGHAPGVFNAVVYGAMKLGMGACVAGIKACNSNLGIVNATVCMAAAEACNLLTQIPYRLTGKNPYDMRIKCEHGNLCYDFDNIEKYLNQATVQSQLGVSKKWGSCNMAVNLQFQLAGDWMRDFSHMIPDLLHDGVEVLIYAGDEDYICNWLGNKAWTKALEWNSKDAFNSADDVEWQVEGKTAARHRNAGSFHFMQIFEAGHMVPMDQPSVSLEMVNAFITGSLKKNERPVDSVVV
jgi:cathepsin A (carboxypeptidase C)